jgi:hypothetical protein
MIKMHGFSLIGMTTCGRKLASIVLFMGLLKNPGAQQSEDQPGYRTEHREPDTDVGD